MKQAVIILSLFCVIVTYAQEKPVGSNPVKGTVDEDGYLDLKWRVIVPENAIVFNLGYSTPTINNTLTNSDFWDKKTGTGINLSVDFRKQFQTDKINDDGYIVSEPKSIAVGVGLGISYLRQSAGFENFSENLSDYTDVDGDQCDINLNYQDVKESIALTYLNVPVYVEIGKPSQVKISPYFKLGVKASLLISEKVSTFGIYTSTGYYPNVDANLHDIIALGYHADKPCYDNPEYELSPFVLWGVASVGVNFPFSSLENNKIASWILRVGATIEYSLTPVSKSLPDSYFSGTAYRLNQSNMLGGNGSRILSPELSLSLIYCF